MVDSSPTSMREGTLGSLDYSPTHQFHISLQKQLGSETEAKTLVQLNPQLAMLSYDKFKEV